MRVLIVDNVYTNRFLLAEIFRKLKIDFDEVTNGKEAIEALRKHDYELILMDIEMPVMNGLETTAYIRKKMGFTKSQPFIVALTAHNTDTFYRNFSDIGFDMHLTKPYSIDKISAIIDSLNNQVNR